MTRYVAQTVSTVPEINAELEKIQESIAELLSRTGDTPNQMDADLDMNSRRGINGTLPLSNSDLVIKKYVDDLVNGLQAGNGVDLNPSIVEAESLASGQKTVIFTIVDAQQSIFYLVGANVDSRRMLNPQDLTIDSPTQVTLQESYPVGTELVALQPTA